jgi:hypothetical protein
VLKQLKWPKDHTLNFKKFEELNDMFPAAYAPIFNLQNSMRKRVSVPTHFDLLGNNYLLT